MSILLITLTIIAEDAFVKNAKTNMKERSNNMLAEIVFMTTVFISIYIIIRSSCAILIKVIK